MADLSKEFQQPLAHARVLAARMQTATENLNRVLTEAEALFTSLQLGVRASVVLPSVEGIHVRLTFGKFDKDWRLIYESQANGANWEFSPLANASREARLKAIESLPALLHAIVEQTKREVVDVEEAVERGEVFLKGIRETLAT